MAMFMEIARDLSADDNNEDDDVLEELDCDDDDFGRPVNSQTDKKLFD